MDKNTVIQGTVIRGRALGGKLGFPTANVRMPHNQSIEVNGVYLARVTITSIDRQYFALVNVGNRPTVEGDGEPLAEAYLIGYEGTLYGEEIRIELLEYLRPEKRFDSIDELRLAIEKDLKNAEKLIETYESGL